MQVVNRTQSFLQNKAHETKSARFQPIEPALIERVLNEYGFDLVHLKSGKAKKSQYETHQTTIARYRSRNALTIDGGLYIDLIFKVPHLYGALEGVLGLFRGVCANQLNVGYRFETIRVKHIGTPIEQLRELIPQLVAQQKQIEAFVVRAKNTSLSYSDALKFARDAAMLRIGDEARIIELKPAQLLTARRDADLGQDLFSVFNVVQENLVRHGVQYLAERAYKIEVDGVPSVQTKVVQAKSRPIKTSTNVELSFNGALWSLVEDTLGAAAA